MESNEITYRAARREDAPAIVEFQISMARETEDLALDRAVCRAGVAGVFDEPSRGRYFVAESGGEVLASLLGLGSTPATASTDAPVAEPEVLPAYSADGVPLPKPAPRDSGRMMALAPPQPESAESRSTFSRLFSFGDESLPAQVPPVSTEAPPEVMASAVTASSSSGAEVGMAAACDGGGGECAATTIMEAPAPPAEERSIIDRIGNWF